MFMNFEILIGLLSLVFGILGFFAPNKFKSNKWLCAGVIVFMTLVSGFIVYYNSELERINNIHRQAMAIYEQNGTYSINKEYIQEVLTFLEENKDRYPDSYERAKQIYSDMKESENQYDQDATNELRGIIKCIATLNKE